MQQQKLFNAIFNPSGKETADKSFVDAITMEHPYFGLAQFYALKKTALLTDEYNDAAAKACLYFNSHFFLNSQLLITQNDEELIDKKIEVIDIKDENKNGHSILQTEVLEEKEITIETKEDEALLNDSKIKNFFSPEVKDSNQNLPEEPQIIFEPLHASDYFASQGIKLSEEAMANDKLGKQLKSFTAWLKTMKKVHSDKLPTVTAIVETAVQNQAEKSNIEEEIVTEPMAEAYLLQNKLAKASEIYIKLSLLNPEKSAYFAAKIDSLKK